jgi:hypothetical protein
MIKYEVVQSEPERWTVGFRLPYTEDWERDSEHESAEAANERAGWLNGPLDAGMVYRRTAAGAWTTGFFGRFGIWSSASAWANQEDAARAVADNNGSAVIWPETSGRPL